LELSKPISCGFRGFYIRVMWAIFSSWLPKT